MLPQYKLLRWHCKQVRLKQAQIGLLLAICTTIAGCLSSDLECNFASVSGNTVELWARPDDDSGTWAVKAYAFDRRHRMVGEGGLLAPCCGEGLRLKCDEFEMVEDLSGMIFGLARRQELYVVASLEADVAVTHLNLHRREDYDPIAAELVAKLNRDLGSTLELASSWASVPSERSHKP